MAVGRRVLFDGVLALGHAHARVVVPVAGVRACRVAVNPYWGTWSTSTVSVEPVDRGVARAFSSGAKSIAAGGGVVVVTEDEMRGVVELEVRQAGSVDANAEARVVVTADEGD
jgi:hypothetical protein